MCVKLCNVRVSVCKMCVTSLCNVSKVNVGTVTCTSYTVDYTVLHYNTDANLTLIINSDHEDE